MKPFLLFSGLHKKIVPYLGFLFTFCCIIIYISERPARSTELEELVRNGSYFVDTTPPTRTRESELFIPASTIKLLTCFATLDYLGEDHRFETHFFTTKSGDLYIKGFGDPFLTSETIEAISLRLKEAGFSKFHNIILDDSVFDLKGNNSFTTSSSSNPYDAPYGALAVNFNSLPLVKNQDGVVISGEPQTPTLPIMSEIAQHLFPGKYRLNIGWKELENKTKITPNHSMQLRYVGELFQYKLQAAGIQVTGVLIKDKPMVTDRNLTPLLVYYNPISLKEIVKGCLKYSNNYIANQLFLACGLQKYGPPATWDKARLFMKEYIGDNFHNYQSEIVVSEGSGLSRKNRVSSQALISILNRFKPYANLLVTRDNLLLKSGTLKDVFCYAGYIKTSQSLQPMVILLNQKNNTRDRVLEKLTERNPGSTM